MPSKKFGTFTGKVREFGVKEGKPTKEVISTRIFRRGRLIRTLRGGVGASETARIIEESRRFEEIRKAEAARKEAEGARRKAAEDARRAAITRQTISITRAREARGVSETARAIRIEEARRAQLSLSEQTRRNNLVRQLKKEFKDARSKLIKESKTGKISKKEFGERFIELNKTQAKQFGAFKESQGALTSKETRIKFRKEVKDFEKAQGSKITDKQLTAILSGKTVTTLVKIPPKVFGPQLLPRPSSIISAFERKTLINVLRDKRISSKDKIRTIKEKIKKFRIKIPEGTFDRFFKGLQKVAVTKRFRSKEIKAEQEKKIKDFRKRLEKKKGKIDLADEMARSFEDKDVATFSKITGATAGVFNPVLGASIWAVGDVGERIERRKGEKDIKLTKGELGRVAVTAATEGAILGFLMKVGGHGLDIAGKRILIKAAAIKTENAAMKAAVNHGGQLIKLTGKGGKNVITTYFYKDIAGNIFEVTADVKNRKFNNALTKITETGGAIGGFISGSIIGTGAVKGALAITGRKKPIIPERVEKKIPLDVMARQLLTRGKIILTRRGVYETGRGLVPRKDAWLDPSIRIPTKGIFWRFDKTLDKKGDAISPLPLFTKDKSRYWNMFKKNWEKNKGLGLIKRYIKTTAETPVVDDILIRKTINIKDIKDKKLRDIIIKEFATTGRLTKTTQNKVLKQKLPFSDKARERGFHDENEFVTRKVMKLKNKKDISWAFDPILKEFIPVVQSLKDAGRIKNFLTILRKKKIITKTDAQYIKDNFAIKKKFRKRAILPPGHSFEHMNNVGKNIIKLINKYPEFNKHWKKKYGSIANAKAQLRKAMWHDIGKTSESSIEFGTPHGQKVWNVWKAGLLPKGIKLKKDVAKAIKVHENLDPRKIRYKIRNKIGRLTPEEKIVATADRLDLSRFGFKIVKDKDIFLSKKKLDQIYGKRKYIEPARLPLRDSTKRLNIKSKGKDFPKKFNKIIKRVRTGQKVSKKDIEKLTSWKPRKISKPTRPRPRPSPRPRPRPSPRPRPRPSPRPRPRPSPRPRPRPTPTRRLPPRAPPEGPPPTRRFPSRPPIRIPPSAPPTRRPPTRVPPRRPPTRVPPKPPVIIPRGIKRKPTPKAKQSFNVFGKSGKKFFKLSKKPLSKKAALDRGAYAVDHTTSRTFFTKPAGRVKNLGTITNKEKGHFQKTRKQFRNFRIVKGKRKAIGNRFIERTRHAINTRGEKTQLSIAKLRKQQFGFGKPKRKVIRRSSTQRIQALKRNSVRSRVIPSRTISRPTMLRSPILKRNPLGQFIKRSKR